MKIYILVHITIVTLSTIYNKLEILFSNSPIMAKGSSINEMFIISVPEVKRELMKPGTILSQYCRRNDSSLWGINNASLHTPADSTGWCSATVGYPSATTVHSPQVAGTGSLLRARASWSCASRRPRGQASHPSGATRALSSAHLASLSSARE